MPMRRALCLEADAAEDLPKWWGPLKSSNIAQVDRECVKDEDQELDQEVESGGGWLVHLLISKCSHQKDKHSNTANKHSLYL
jgi:hypothetical protein